LILFSSHSETVTPESGKIVRALRSATLYSINRCNGVDFEDGTQKFRSDLLAGCSNLFWSRQFEILCGLTVSKVTSPEASASEETKKNSLSFVLCPPQPRLAIP
jgi:hypothetical protein